MKSIEYAQEAATPIANIIEIVRKSIIKYEFQYAPIHTKMIQKFNNNPPIYLIQQYYTKANRVRVELE